MTSDGIFDVKKAYKLDTPERFKELRPFELLKNVAGITTGDICVDFGSGTGIFALPMAELIGAKGKVYTVDNSTDMQTYLKSKNPPPNIIQVQSDARKTGLESNIADLCFLAFILHEVKEPETLVAEAFRLLKTNGKLLVLDWKAELDSPGPPKRVRISKEMLQNMFDKIGLIFKSYIDWTYNHYVVLAETENKLRKSNLQPD